MHFEFSSGDGSLLTTADLMNGLKIFSINKILIFINHQFLVFFKTNLLIISKLLNFSFDEVFIFLLKNNFIKKKNMI